MYTSATIDWKGKKVIISRNIIKVEENIFNNQ